MINKKKLNWRFKGNELNYVSEVLMFVKGIEKKTKENVDSVIISLTGNIDVNKIAEITDTFVNETNKK